MAKVDTRLSDEGLEHLRMEAAKIEQTQRLTNPKARYTASDLVREMLAAKYPDVDFSVKPRGGDQKSEDAKARRAARQTGQQG